ncbi:hypothetical protein [Methanoculleus frigidifontis]|uniref:hypothetical protein n=1 Tax=Methanoculleus frigidifontis TaxID=2584085 RepID=UPI0026596CD0|nr:hypothetical protein [Methanoculleus sp. FWC-SCC1]
MARSIGDTLALAVGVAGVAIFLLGLLLFFLMAGSVLDSIIVILAGLALMGIAWYFWK